MNCIKDPGICPIKKQCQKGSTCQKYGFVENNLAQQATVDTISVQIFSLSFRIQDFQLFKRPSLAVCNLPNGLAQRYPISASQRNFYVPQILCTCGLQIVLWSVYCSRLIDRKVIYWQMYFSWRVYIVYLSTKLIHLPRPMFNSTSLPPLCRYLMLPRVLHQLSIQRL